MDTRKGSQWDSGSIGNKTDSRQGDSCETQGPENSVVKKHTEWEKIFATLHMQRRISV